MFVFVIVSVCMFVIVLVFVMEEQTRVNVKQINIIAISTCFLLTVFFSVFCLAWLCYEA